MEVAFDGSASALDLGGDCALRSYAWHFGDGEVAEPPVYGARVQHRYDTPGRYLATLTVDDESGISGRAHVPVLVRPARDGRWLSVWLRDSHADTQSCASTIGSCIGATWPSRGAGGSTSCWTSRTRRPPRAWWRSPCG